MTLILGLDCSTGWTSMGLVENRQAIGECTFNLGRRQSSRLPGLLKTLLAESHRDLRNIDIFAITTGPGFFTGIRVGLSYAAGLAYALGKPVLGVSTLFAMAYPFLLEGVTTIPVLRARSDGVFVAKYRHRKGQIDRILENAFLSPAELVSMVDRNDIKSTIFVGEDIAAFPDISKMAEKSLSWETRPVSGLSIAMLGDSRKKDATSPLVVGARYFRGPDIGYPRKTKPQSQKQ